MLNSLAGLLLRRGDPTGLYLEANTDARLVLQDLAGENKNPFIDSRPVSSRCTDVVANSILMVLWRFKGQAPWCGR